VGEVQDVLRAIEEGIAAGERMALATIVAARGSTYRREGARFLVREAGKPVGNISGGCLEGDVRVAAVEVMEDGVPRLMHFDLTADDEVVWGWGLGCNGVIDVFVEPAEGAARTAGILRRAIDARRPIASVIVIEARPDAGTTPGTRVAVHPDGSVEGSLGDPSLDGPAADEGRSALADGRSLVVALGEGVRAFVEVMVPPIRLVVCGAGHDAIPLVAFAAELGWRVEVVDDRDAFLNPSRFPGAVRLVKSEPGDAAAAVGADDRTHVVVMSHNFLRDKDYLRAFLGSGVAYLGMLGPKARLERLLAELDREGVHPSSSDLDVVHGPAGLDLGGDGPREVAWAIVGEILALAKGRTGGFLKDLDGPIHDRPKEPEATRA
jgi:xanthine/CO dehydrogenase XdhC/CoxF family maturation factor